MRFLTTAVAALALAGAAQAAEWPDTPAQLAGVWSLSGLTEGTESCVFTMEPAQTIGGWTVNFPNRCKTAFPVGEVAAWRVDPSDGSIVFADAQRNALLRFVRTEDGAYVANPEGKPGMVIMKGDPALQRPPTAQEAMTGLWKLSGLGGGALCRFTLTSDAQGRNGTMTMHPGCVGEWKVRDLTRWTIRGKEITLWNRKGQPIRSLRRADTFTFENRQEMGQHLGRGDMLFFGKILRGE